MYEKHRYCCLLFDEMSIRENVWFNQKFECIERYEVLGSQGRTCNIANHALHFMVRGLYHKGKQPVAYYLSRGSTKAEMLKQFLKEFLNYARMLDCMLLPLSVTWVPTTSRP